MAMVISTAHILRRFQINKAPRHYLLVKYTTSKMLREDVSRLFQRVILCRVNMVANLAHLNPD